MNKGGEIVLNGVSKRYKSGEKFLDVLRGVDLKIPQGRRLAVIGRSGSGKSTLLNLIGTLDRGNSGKITHGGLSVTDLSEKEIALWRNQNIGFIFQFHRLLPDFTALENVMIPGMVSRMDSGKNKENAEKLIKAVGLESRMYAKPWQLSGGEQQRVAIARAMALAPPYILADEPTGNLDSETADSVFKLLLDACAKNNSTLILVTHNRDLVSKLDECLELREGKLRKI